jgi:PAS domain S-box-containing protein
MKKKINSVVSSLRQNAEDVINKRSHGAATAPSEPDILKLTHELEVFQIELEMQIDELQKSDILLKACMECQKDTILFAIDSHYRYLYFNKVHADVMKFAYNKEVGVGMNILDCISSPADRAEAKKDYDQALKGESHTNIRVFGDLNLAHYESFFNPIRDNYNNIIGATGLARDITRRIQSETKIKEQEFQFHMLADSGLALIWTSGLDKLCNYFNEPWLKFTGRTLEQEMGNGWAEGVHPDDLDSCVKIYVSAFDKREPFDMEYRLRHVSGEYRWIRDMGIPNYNTKGDFIGYIGDCFDITEIKRNEEITGKKTEQLEALNKYFVGRELKMIELKKEINELIIKAGGKEKYVIHGQ